MKERKISKDAENWFVENYGYEIEECSNLSEKEFRELAVSLMEDEVLANDNHDKEVYDLVEEVIGYALGQ